MKHRPAAVAVTALAFSFVLAACAFKPTPKPSDYVVLLPSVDGSVGKVFVVGKSGAQILDTVNNAAQIDGDGTQAAISPEKIREVFGAAMDARSPLPAHFYLYFESGGSKLTPESEALIPEILQKIQDRDSANISVIGHTDTAGKADANAKLAYQRATAIATMLRNKGMESATLTISSHGEADLLVPTPDETPEAKNRRVEINIR